MNLIPVKTPKLIKGIFSKYVWDMPNDQKTIYLTFDDGPTPEITNWTLDLLKRYDAKATFFCIGNNIEKHPKIFHDILNDGHAIGNHTFHHPRGWYTKTDTFIKEVLQTEEAIKFQVLNSKFQIPTTTKLFRPPYGQITSKQGKTLIKLGYKIIMWDVLAFDWKADLSKEKCAENVISETTPGSIIVYHDSIKASERMKYALAQTLKHFSKEGYRFKSIE